MITCVLRFVVFYKTDIMSDPTWFCIEMTIWTTAESGLYLIAACLPSLRSLLPLIIKHENFGKFRTKLSGYHSKLFSRQKSSADDSENKQGRGCDGKTGLGMTIGPRRPSGKWARSEGPASSGDDNALESLTACYWESAPHSLQMGNSDLDLERGDQGIRIQKSYEVSTDTTASQK